MKLNPPSWLDTIAKQYWHKLKSKISIEDFELFALLCSSLSIYRHAQQSLVAVGVLIDNDKGGLKQNPASYVTRDAHAQIVSVLKELLLTPKTRAEDNNHEPDELDLFLANP